MEKSDDSAVDSVDYGFISKYIKEDSGVGNDDKENREFSKRFETRNSNSTEVFSSIGQGESFSGSDNQGNNYNNSNNGFKNRYKDSNISGQNYDEDIEVDIPEDVETKSESSPVIEAKKEFLKQMQDESLSLDTASRITHDWGK